MWIRVETRVAANITPESTRDIDFSKPGNRKWLVSHMRWAFSHNREVTTFAI